MIQPDSSQNMPQDNNEDPHPMSQLDRVILVTGEVTGKKRKRLEKLNTEELGCYQLRTMLTNACKVYMQS